MDTKERVPFARDYTVTESAAADEVGFHFLRTRSFSRPNDLWLFPKNEMLPDFLPDDVDLAEAMHKGCPIKDDSFDARRVRLKDTIILGFGGGEYS